MEHRTQFTPAGRSGLQLRYRLVPGSTARYETRLNLYMEIRRNPDDEPAIIDAQIYANFDFEVLRVERGLGLVRLYAHRTDLWVRSGSTVDEDQITDPLSGLSPAFLLDDLGSTVPVVDLDGSAVAPPDDGNAARFVLKSLFAPFVEEAVNAGDQWEVELAQGTTNSKEPVVVHVELGRIVTDKSGRIAPILTHKCHYEWSVGDASKPGGIESHGYTKHVTESTVAPENGWPTLTESKIQVESTIRSNDGRQQLVSTAVELRAERV